jgi:hypothetical protein
VLGDYQACSLFSPMFDFVDNQSAREIALASLDALFDVASRELGDTGRGTTLTPTPPTPSTSETDVTAPTLSKRGFLFGSGTVRGP